MHGLRQRGHDFLDAELQLSMLPRLLRRDDFVARFQRTVLADSSQQLQTAVQGLRVDGRQGCTASTGDGRAALVEA